MNAAYNEQVLKVEPIKAGMSGTDITAGLQMFHFG